MTTGKTIALTRQTFVDKVMSLLFNMLSRLVITFLPRLLLLLSRFSHVQLCAHRSQPIDGIDGSPPDSAIPGILQAGTLEWVAISVSNAG